MVVVVCVCGSVTAATATAATAALHSAVCGDVYATNTHTQEHYDSMWRRRRRRSSKTEYQTLNRADRKPQTVMHK